eukprot:6713501-Pyramimonas_sp.AAC.1
MTSDEWIFQLIEDLHHMELYQAEYEIWHAGGGLRRSKLWHPGQQRPLTFGSGHAARSAPKIRVAD